VEGFVITFKVNDVEPGRMPKGNGDAQVVVAGPLKTQFEAFDVIGNTNEHFGSKAGLYDCIHWAWANHCNLKLRPDDIWLAVCQAAAACIKANAEKLRKRFVTHNGQTHLEFVRTSRKFVWSDAIDDIICLMREQTHAGFVEAFDGGGFTTSARADAVARHMVLLDAASPYFTYGGRIICGIPSVTLTGTPDDWQKICDRGTALAKLVDEPRWAGRLNEVLTQFVSASRGNVDIAFWRDCFLYKSMGCGSAPFATGWTNAFYPYLFNPYDRSWRLNDGESLREGTAPCAISEVGLKLVGGPNGDEQLRLFGGFMTVGYDRPTNTIQPVVGWGVGT